MIKDKTFPPDVLAELGVGEDATVEDTLTYLESGAALQFVHEQGLEQRKKTRTESKRLIDAWKRGKTKLSTGCVSM